MGGSSSIPGHFRSLRTPLLSSSLQFYWKLQENIETSESISSYWKNTQTTVVQKKVKGNRSWR